MRRPTAPLGNVTWSDAPDSLLEANWKSVPKDNNQPTNPANNVFILCCLCAKICVLNHWNTQENVRHCLALKELIIQLKKGGLSAKIFNNIRLSQNSSPRPCSEGISV